MGQAQRISALEQLLEATFDPQIRYQLLHRTASALLTAADFHAPTAVMVVHAWNATPQQRVDLERFCTAMEADALAPGVWRTRRAGRTLFMAWCDGDPRHTRTILPDDDGALCTAG
ncbi:hypothetical protein JI739_22190 [Ramlibacter sp. AW1]|uniref:DUF6946 domain-containing protein n=1 Tax=Ramlibacter aurantiacus TaxID=2801330 RepID=A0A937D3U2_9BURK|nr:hypothetical protein [Ramlibacter aurantiacus]MBL0423064.1 hypothetical protein [Ramlibacter aurantiacus]